MSIAKSGALPSRSLVILFQTLILAAMVSALSGCPGGTCGDGTARGSEACDDGNTVDGDGCSATCTIETASCGNGVVDGTEECDDGELNSNVTVDACRTDCTNARCGDMVVDTGEGCDPPGPNCTTACVAIPAGCGNGTLDAGEACDDGNNNDGDGCDASCQFEPTTCGDGVLAGAEQCEDGNSTAGDGCDAACMVEAGYCGPRNVINCGDTVMADSTDGWDLVDDWLCNQFPDAGPETDFVLTIAAGRSVTVNLTVTNPDNDLIVVADTAGSCDPSSAAACLGASFNAGTDPETVTFDALPGDYHLIVDTYNAMDGGPGGPFTLEVVCGTPAVCGNGTIETGEGCDDGNTTAADGCDATCGFEAGFLCAGEPSVCAVATTVTSTPALPVPDNDPVGVTDTLDFTTGCFITAIAVDVDISTTWVGDLIVEVTSPAGTTVRLHNRTGGSADDLIGQYPTNLVPFETLDTLLGEDGLGTWTLLVSDNEAMDTATVNSWGVTMVCGTPPVCGDGLVGIGEGCDDANTAPGDGCDGGCGVEAMYYCAGEPSVCTATFLASGTSTPALAIPDDDPTGVTDLVSIGGPACTVVDVNVDVDISHTYSGDLHVALTSPDGLTTVVLHLESGDPTDDIIGNYPATLTPSESLDAFLGTAGVGDWTLSLVDTVAMDVGTLNSWSVNLTCIP